ncbi:BT_3987 domain-containing protein [Ferruginibacter sp.]
MKTKIFLAPFFTTIAAVLLLSTGCKKKNDFGQPVILITGTESYPIVKFSVENTPATYLVSATSTIKAPTDIKVNFALDTGAVTAFNKAHNTTYFGVPASAVEVTNVETVIKAGSSVSSSVSVKMLSTAPLVDGRSYLIPITITSFSGGSSDISVLESSRTIFLRVARVISFPALSMNNSNAGTTGTPGTRGRFNATAILDATNPVQLANFTLEIKNLIYAYRTGDGNTNPQPIQTLISWSSYTEDKSIGLRYAELGNPSNSLQLIGSLGSAFAYNFNANQWYTISLSYDGSKMSMYVDGVKAAEVSGSMVLPLSRLNLGQNWGGYDTKQYVNGRIAECRVWSRALTASEIKLNLCGADPNADGLVAYWKFNEGSGTKFKNSSSAGAKYDLDWTKVYWDNAGSGTLVAVDKSAYVTWTNDILNKCSQ